MLGVTMYKNAGDGYVRVRKFNTYLIGRNWDRARLPELAK
jgi:hypothetical protein